MKLKSITKLILASTLLSLAVVVPVDTASALSCVAPDNPTVVFSNPRSGARVFIAKVTRIEKAPISKLSPQHLSDLLHVEVRSVAQGNVYFYEVIEDLNSGWGQTHQVGKTYLFEAEPDRKDGLLVINPCNYGQPMTDRQLDKLARLGHEPDGGWSEHAYPGSTVREANSGVVFEVGEAYATVRATIFGHWALTSTYANIGMALIAIVTIVLAVFALRMTRRALGQRK